MLKRILYAAVVMLSCLIGVLTDPSQYLHNLNSEMLEGVPCDKKSQEHGTSVKAPITTALEESSGAGAQGLPLVGVECP
jgi:hypothetical protein